MKNKLRNLYVKYLFFPALTFFGLLLGVVFAVGFYPLRWLTSPKQMDELLYRLNGFDVKGTVKDLKELKETFNVDGVQ